MQIVVVGGCGHVGLPLSVSLASAGHIVTVFDINERSVDSVNNGIAPFWEPELNEALNLNVGKSLFASLDKSVISSAEIVIFIVGTPVDGHLNPDPNSVVRSVSEVANLLRDEQLVVLRSTVFPGVTARVERELNILGKKSKVVFCPERIAEGYAMKELRTLPQIIGARDSHSADRATLLFESLGIKTIRTSPEEAELAKLFTNTWRYIKFAAANQFWMMANDAGVDFENVREAICFEYPRADDLPGAGFAAGPCLFKDTMQLSAFSNNTFALGNSAMMVNEGLPLYLVERLASKYDLSALKIGILGMAFKGESDDNRSSLAYKLKRILQFKSDGVFTTDPYVKNDTELIDFDDVLKQSDVLIIAAPHKIYSEFVTDKPVYDIWNLRGLGSAV